MLRSEYPPNIPMPIPRMDSSKATAIRELLNEPGNDVCADCGATLASESAWAVLAYGILVCDDCKLVHIEHENHYNATESNGNDNSVKGILSTQIPQLWEDKDIAQIRANGNKRTNIRLLANSPVWQYRPSGNDGIKLKEYWIKCKYSGNAGDAAENPKIAAKKQFIGIQFTRPMPKGKQQNINLEVIINKVSLVTVAGNYPCCVVLQSDKLYLTSDARNEEVPVECVETLVVNSKRIGHENGVQLTYRINNDGNTVAFTYLQHDNMETVMDWVSLVLYTKYNLLKRKYPTMIDVNVAKILNCGMIKESYMHVTGRGLIYLSLSEARLSCFQHHLDDKPLFQIAVSEVMNLTATQYLDAVACFFDIDASKIQSYADWVTALELVLKTDKISAMPDDVPKPSFPFSLLKKADKPPPAPAPERNEPTPPINHVPKPVPVTTAPSIPPAQLVPPTPITNGEKETDKKPSNYECYPPIGPMGEMGELPPEAIKPPPSKNDVARIGVFGEYVPGHPLPTVTQLQPIKVDSFGDLANPALTSYPTTLNTAVASGIINPGLTKEPSCYPPIGGPAQAMKLRYAELSAAMQAQFVREQELEELRNGNLLYRTSSMAQKQALFDQSRLQSNPAFARGYSESDASAFATMPPPNFQGWGDNGADNLLTMPWKQTVNGFEPSRGFNASSTAYPDRLAWNAAKLQAAALERKLPTQDNKNLAGFGTWGSRPQSGEPVSTAISRAPSGWGSNLPTGKLKKILVWSYGTCHSADM
uniref:Zinc finger protein n=1 Tax=Ciona intestinalis TaxID=7719 RepID=Q1RLI4_CIOIN|nr:zinc finger protein Ci-ArfGAP-1 [Ciona intestinalis]FAA00081.1 TPA: zinc finger protein [Ciona intestinalis]|eukprot:NP_001121596.1 zinc finger protein Ci-ArfGAP-1 [Ciona intestinalis]